MVDSDWTPETVERFQRFVKRNGGLVRESVLTSPPFGYTHYIVVPHHFPSDWLENIIEAFEFVYDTRSSQ